MASTLVIKVRHADTLRRFNALVRDDGQLSLDMEGLTAKILGLFNIPPTAEISLTYIDEDGDVVTLVDDYDLQDVTRQDLKFLKVDVSIKHAKGCFSNSAAPSGVSTPSTYQQIKNTSSNSISGASSYSSLNSAPKAVSSGAPIKTVVPEIMKSVPLCEEALCKLSKELASENGSFSPVFTYQQPEIVPNVNTQTGSEKTPTAPFAVPVVPGDGTLHEGLVKDNAPSETTPDGLGPMLSNPVSHSIDLNLDCRDDFPPLEKSMQSLVNNQTTGEDDGKELKDQSVRIPVLTDTSQPRNTTCPKRNMVFTASSPHVPAPLHVNPSKSCHSQNDGMVGLLHQNIVCDGCGVVPIAGPRYKSKVKEDYDLCSQCFAVIGNGADYIKMTTPMSSRGLHDPVQKVWVFPEGRPGLLKLDNCFISDVNVVDGTIMPPSTKFTKIWRMRNTGLVAWPRGTKLVRIGGDRFSDIDTSDLKIPAHGVPVDAEVDISIDFTSPALPGRYLSSWRMASPYGTLFGQGIWVHIQVDASLNETSAGASRCFNLNVLPESDELKGPEAVDANHKPVFGGGFSESLEFTIKEQAKTEQEKNFPVNDTLLVGNGISASAQINPPAIGISKKPTELEGMNGVDDAVEKMLLQDLEQMGFKEINLNKEILRLNQYDLEQSLNDLCGVAELDDSILEELEEMGFSDRELNKTLLRKNNGSIKRVVMDLLS